MALTQEQINRVQARLNQPAPSSSLTPEQIQRIRARLQTAPAASIRDGAAQPPTQTKRGTGIKATLDRIGEDRGTEVLRSVRGFQQGEQTAGETGAQIGLQTLGAASDVVGSAIIGAGKILLPKAAEEAIAGAATKGISSFLQTRPGQMVQSGMEALEKDTRATRNIKGLLAGAEFGVDFIGGAGVKRAAKPVTQAVKQSTAAPRAAVREAADAPITNIQVKRAAKGKQRELKKLEEVGFQKDVSNLIKNAAPETKADMRDLLKRGQQKSSSRLQSQPIFKIGKEFVDDVKTVTRQLKKTNDSIRKKIANTPNTPTDLTSARNRFVRRLENLGARVEGNEIVGFGQRIDNAADQKIIKETLDFLSDNKGVVDVYRRNQALFDRLQLGKKNNELSIAESITSQLRTDLKRAVDKKIPGINKEQREVAKLMRMLEPASRALGGKFSPEDLATVKAQEIIGRLLNRNQGRPTEILRDIVRTSAKLKGKNPDRAWTEFLRKVEFTDVVEDVFGIAPSRAFKPQVSKGVSDAMTDVALDFVPYGGTIKTVAKGIFGKEKPLREQQIKALNKLLGIK